MSRPRSAPAWRAAFLRELARTGSVAAAADAVGIDRSSAYQARKRNPAFATSWERALADARARLAGDRSDAPLRLRDDEVVRASKDGRPCLVRAGPGRWCAGKERRFLAALSASANVRAAAKAAGVSTVAVYNRRREWSGFARAWDAAKAEGYVRLEMLLLDAATCTLDPAAATGGAGGEADAAPPAMSVGEALNLLRLHRASVQGGAAQRYGWRRRAPDMDEVRAEIMRKLAAIKRARAARGARAGDGGAAAR